MMYSDTNRVLEEKRKLMINPHHFWWGFNTIVVL
jgi:hypothetical protein